MMYAAVIGRDATWITNGVVSGFGEMDALAATYSLSGDIIVLGTDRVQMAVAANEIIESGGGIAIYHGGRKVFQLQLPLFGLMSTDGMDTLIEETRKLVDFLRGFGYAHEDPIYSLVFLGVTHLPNVRMTKQGVYNIKTRERLVRSTPL